MIDGDGTLQGPRDLSREQQAPRPSRPGLAGRLRRSLFGISVAQTRAERRGFQVWDPDRSDLLARVGESFLAGYHGALLDPEPTALAERLDAEVELGWRGFAYEGAGMGLALQDALLPRRSNRLHAFLAGPGACHRYLVIVGAGWTFARLPRRYDRALTGLDPVLRWLAFDGYGFHHGYFGWRRSVDGRRVPRRLHGYARNVFDQGLGRSLWFVRGMDPGSIATTVDTFPEVRRGDLWSGVGLACAFAGGLPREGVRELRRLAGRWAGHAAQGAAFAARARTEAGEGTPWLDTACAVLCGAEVGAVVAVVDRVRRALPPDGSGPTELEPGYEVWRRRVREEIEEIGGGGAGYAL